MSLAPSCSLPLSFICAGRCFADAHRHALASRIHVLHNCTQDQFGPFFSSSEECSWSFGLSRTSASPPPSGMHYFDWPVGNRSAAVLLVAGGTALGSNLINNVPMSLVMVSALHPPGPLIRLHIIRLLRGNVRSGPRSESYDRRLALATMLWLLILRRKGLEVSTWEYFKLGMIFVPALIVIGSLLIWVEALIQRRSNAYPLCNWPSVVEANWCARSRQSRERG